MDERSKSVGFLVALIEGKLRRGFYTGEVFMPDMIKPDEVVESFQKANEGKKLSFIPPPKGRGSYYYQVA